MTQPLRILVVDDEPQIHRFLRPSLDAAGFAVLAAMNGAEATRVASTSAPDLVILDLGLPDIDGKEVIAALRRSGAMPIIVLSARDRESEKIAALDAGADDYINKPFGIGELLARIRSQLRRGAQQRDKPLPANLTIDDLRIDVAEHRVTRLGMPVHLTPKEFELLLLLARHAGRVLTHRQILTEIWGPAHGTDTQYLRVFIGQLRQKIEADPSEPKLIQTEPGVGYRLEPPDHD